MERSDCQDGRAKCRRGCCLRSRGDRRAAYNLGRPDDRRAGRQVCRGEKPGRRKVEKVNTADGEASTYDALPGNGIAVNAKIAGDVTVGDDVASGRIS